MPRALYLHVPFCPVICPYCDFHKMKRHEGLVAAYLTRLEEEAEALHNEFPGGLDTIYLGGGTPSMLTNEELERVAGIFSRTWVWPAKETTLEADPLTFDKKRLEALRALGFNRLSIGLQSTQDEVLTFLGRRHSAREGLEAVTWALEAGFNVSADLITAVPGQDAAKDLRALGDTGVPHVSVYNLSVEPYTSFARRKVHVDPDKEADDYALAQTILEAYGLNRYEVSNHARSGFESRHNLAYWRMDYYLALGPSASGFVPGAERRVGRPMKAWLKGEAPERIKVSPKDFAEDALMAGLRTQEGVDLARLERRSGFPVLAHHRPLFESLQARGLLELKGTRLRATEEGLWKLNALIEMVFSYRPAEVA